MIANRVIPAFLLLSACTQNQSAPNAFFDTLLSLCGETFEGRVVSEQAVDTAWRAEVLTVGPVSCAGEVVRMPLAVGADTSRTWVFSQTEKGLLFRHEHTEPDGSPSPVTQYGGLAREGGTAAQQAFPADAQTKANFTENGIAVSNPNVWTVTIENAQMGYALARPATDDNPARDFRAVFDLPN